MLELWSREIPLKPEPTEIFILFKNICQHFGRDPNPKLNLALILILTLTCINCTPLNGWIKQTVNFKGWKEGWSSTSSRTLPSSLCHDANELLHVPHRKRGSETQKYICADPNAEWGGRLRCVCVCFTALQQTKDQRRLARALSRPHCQISVWMLRRQRAGVKGALKASGVRPVSPALPLS